MYDLIEAFGGHAKKGLGQHFLVDSAALTGTVAATKASRNSTVLEVGPGPGVLTRALLQTGARVVAVEKDRRAVSFLRDRFADMVPEAAEHLVVVEGDAQRVDPAVVLGEDEGPFIAAGNLPYNVGTAILLHLLAHRRLFARFVFMFQREVARRLVAEPGSKAYGSLSVTVQNLTAPRIVTELGPESFSPPPAVHSAVVALELRDDPLVPDQLTGAFERTVRAAFSQRRKTLRNSLAAGLSISKDEGVALLERAGIDPSLRAERLGLEDFVALARVVANP